ncbi:MAG: S8 family serine peptidase [Beijerinckiaceae bacterium]
MTEAQREALAASGFRIVAQRNSQAAGGLILRTRIPANRSMNRSLELAKSIAPDADVDRNHLYRNSYRVQAGKAELNKAFPKPLETAGWPAPEAACSVAGVIGVIDTAVDREHPALKGKSVTFETVRGPDLRPSSDRHGTAVAKLILGDGEFPGLAPGASVIMVDAFNRAGSQDEADAFDVASALELLAERRAAVANLSLAGPANNVLDRVGNKAKEAGMIVVAASGNDGPTARPLYPAAYAWAVAVTAIDDQKEIYRRAVRGEHVAIAAPGVRLALKNKDGLARAHTGTSFAAPFVTVALAMQNGNPLEAGPDRVKRLGETASDLGTAGRDPVYGWGLLQAATLCNGAK